MSVGRQALVKAIESALRAGNDATVRRAFDHAFEALPNDLLLYAKWAEYLLGIKDADAFGIALSAHERAKDRADIQLALCSQLFRAGFKEKAHELLPKLSPSEPADHLFLRFTIALDRKDKADAATLCRALLSTEGASAAQLRELAKAAQALELEDAFLSALKRVAAHPHAKPIDHVWLLAAYMDNRSTAAALQHVATLPKNVLAHPAVLDQRAKLCLQVGDNEAAYKLFTALVGIAPQNPDVWAALSELAPREELENLAGQCERALGGATSQQAKLIMTFSLGSMHERLGHRKKSFTLYQDGNAQLKARYVEAGQAYHARDQEVLCGKICEFFPAEMFDGASGFWGGTEDRPKTPVFIVGMPRSGTTLLERMLASLEGVAAGGESPALGRIAYEHLKQIQQDMNLTPANMPHEFWQQRAERYAFETKSTSKFVTDKLPQNYRNLGWALKMFLGAPVIYLKRDPRDVAWSMFKRAFRGTFAYSADQEDLAHAIMMCERYMAHWKSVAPHRILTVSYESLVADPEASSRVIAAHCGLAWNQRCLTPEQLDIPCFTLSRVQVRQPINHSGIGQWQAYEEFLQPFVKRMEGYGIDL